MPLQIFLLGLSIVGAFVLNTCELSHFHVVQRHLALQVVLHVFQLVLKLNRESCANKCGTFAGHVIEEDVDLHRKEIRVIVFD